MSFIFSVPTNALFGAGKLGELRMKIAIQNRYSMMYRDYEKLFQVLEELKTGFVAFLPLANGLLTAAYHSHGEFEKPGRLSKCNATVYRRRIKGK
ncbi:MAG: aldo/keto reductase [Lachnospira sp.]